MNKCYQYSHGEAFPPLGYQSTHHKDTKDTKIEAEVFYAQILAQIVGWVEA
jgi:hypothetical protein